MPHDSNHYFDLLDALLQNRSRSVAAFVPNAIVAVYANLVAARDGRRYPSHLSIVVANFADTTLGPTDIHIL